MENYKIAVGMLIETLEYLLEGFDDEVYIVLEQTDSDFDKEIEKIKKRIEVVRKFEGEL